MSEMVEHVTNEKLRQSAALIEQITIAIWGHNIPIEPRITSEAQFDSADIKLTALCRVIAFVIHLFPPANHDQVLSGVLTLIKSNLETMK